jgi:hypothetical protein
MAGVFIWGGAGGVPGHAGRAFWWLGAAAVAGLVLVVSFDWRGAGEAAAWTHRTGVVLLSVGSFGALQLVWLRLRAGDSVALVARGHAPGVPWLSWVEWDVAFLALVGVFFVTTVVEGHTVLSAVCEYLAFALLMAQTTWLLVLCVERAGALEDAVAAAELDAGVQGGTEEARPQTGRLFAALVAAYCVEAGVVLLAVL